MKTDAIQQLIRISKVAYDEDVSAAASAELAALEADNAAMREAFRMSVLMVKKAVDYNAEIGQKVYKPEHILPYVLNELESALTPDSGKVLVDVEKLREIEWVKHVSNSPDPSEKDVEYWVCPACKEGKDGAHTANCWLAKAMSDGAKRALLFKEES